MDGTTLCSYDIEQEYRRINGIAAIDASRLVVLYDADSAKKKYHVCLFTLMNGRLELAW
jgi:hypothetical protein